LVQDLIVGTNGTSTLNSAKAFDSEQGNKNFQKIELKTLKEEWINGKNSF
jgi:hypothetical protein